MPSGIPPKSYSHSTVIYQDHRRRINTDEKVKVVTAVWGKEFIKFLASLAIGQFALGRFE